MSKKWDLPPEPIPSFLDPTLEVITENDSPHPPLSEFVPLLVDIPLELECDFEQATGLASNWLGEVGWHLQYKGNNLGGWKINEPKAQAYIKQHGHPSRWSRAPGNKNSGDPPWCYYFAFDSILQFIQQWMLKFVPKPEALPPPPTRGADPYRYRKTGAAFWAKRPWFPELCAAGYKGPVTQTRPQASILAHQSLMHTIEEWWAQARLRQTIQNPEDRAHFVIDGVWGVRSIALCQQFEREHGLPVDGALDKATLVMMAKVLPKPAYLIAH